MMEQNEAPKAPKKPRKSMVRPSHAEDLVDHYWGSIGYVVSLIRASEIKAGLILSFYGILLNFIYLSSGTWVDNIVEDTILYILIGSWVLCTAASVLFCIRCFMPRIEGKFTPNVFFYGDVITKFGDVKEFSRTFHKVSMDEDELFSQLGEQIFIVSKISAWKFRNVRTAIRFLAVGLSLLFLTVLYFVFLVLA
ncbi:Pycsar system effector family protein [Ulvibacter antarcticus]|uniref:Pycsar effector protein domain-containing protein n=1 Tax=Ulvibacter antarcticus TaxID=442714 RepID=A0A3L9YGM8_9FLAO|nr:Pycsar system effector family protein [Ulvibacter antarcticus]RMA57295.1 hypothetical protein BXY75_3183 [Ulvibacter antarcticus]